MLVLTYYDLSEIVLRRNGFSFYIEMMNRVLVLIVNKSRKEHNNERHIKNLRI